MFNLIDFTEEKNRFLNAVVVAFTFLVCIFFWFRGEEIGVDLSHRLLTISCALALCAVYINIERQFSMKTIASLMMFTATILTASLKLI